MFPRQSMVRLSAGQDVYVSLAPAGSSHASYYPVTYVDLAQPPTSRSATVFSLSFSISSPALLGAMFRDDSEGRPISTLTLVVRDAPPWAGSRH